MKVLSKTLSKVIPKVMPKVLAKGSGSGDAGIAQCPNLFEPAARIDVNEHAPVNGCTINNPTTTSLQFTAAGADRLTLSVGLFTELGRHQLSCDAWTDDGIKDFRLGVYLGSGGAAGHHVVDVIAGIIRRRVVWEFEVTQDWLDSDTQSFRLRNDAAGTAGQLHVTNFSLSCIIENTVNHRHIYIDASAAGGGDGSEALPYNLFDDINWHSGGANSIHDWVAAGNDVFINLKRDSVWTDTLVVREDGALGHPITIRAYGTGTNPTINNTTTLYCISAPNHSYYTIKELSFDGGTFSNINGINGHGIIIEHCTFNSGLRGIQLEAENNTDTHNVDILNNNFKNLTNVGMNLVVNGAGDLSGSEEGTLHDFHVSYNNIQNCEVGIKFGGRDITTVENNRPYNVFIEYNVVEYTVEAAIGTGSGLTTDPITGKRSIIRGNICNNIGSPTQTLYNVFQLNFCNGVIIEYNLVNRIENLDNNGGAFMLDYNLGNDAFRSTNLIVRYNIAQNCLGTSACKGIVAWCCANCIIHHNIMINMKQGIKVGRAASENNRIYNNTLIGNESGIHLNATAPPTVLRNNLIYDNVEYGINAIIGGSVHDADHNLVYSTVGLNYRNITPGANDINLAPTFEPDTDYELQAGSEGVDDGDNSAWQGESDIRSYKGVPITNFSGVIVAPGGTVDMGAHER